MANRIEMLGSIWCPFMKGTTILWVTEESGLCHCGVLLASRMISGEHAHYSGR